MQLDAREITAPHRLTLDSREDLTLTGVEDVERFDENEIEMSTTAGTLTIRGEGLHIEKLSLDGGDLHITGRVDSLTYEARRSGGGFFSRLLGT
ncbi:MAG: sporulation protein YabP [Oscillospiraceae bacterium]|nr:sporulation protein YabP [Oscillospiraceae bacterium]